MSMIAFFTMQAFILAVFAAHCCYFMAAINHFSPPVRPAGRVAKLTIAGTVCAALAVVLAAIHAYFTRNLL